MDEVSAIRTPTGYGSAFGKHLKKIGFMGLKSHDYHCLVQQIIRVVIRTLLQTLQRTTLIRLGKSLSQICARVVKTELEALPMYVMETICVLEVSFPPAFFDIMQHSLIHLVNELAVCGPVDVSLRAVLGKFEIPCKKQGAPKGIDGEWIYSRHQAASMGDRGGARHEDVGCGGLGPSVEPVGRQGG